LRLNVLVYIHDRVGSSSALIALALADLLDFVSLAHGDVVLVGLAHSHYTVRARVLSLAELIISL
jgi:hypothetical protein